MKVLNVRPIDDRVIVELLPEVKKKVGIILSKEIEEQLNQSHCKKGTVVAVGDGVAGMEMKVKVGDTVLLKEEYGDRIEIEENFYIVFRQCNLICIL